MDISFHLRMTLDDQVLSKQKHAEKLGPRLQIGGIVWMWGLPDLDILNLN